MQVSPLLRGFGLIPVAAFDCRGCLGPLGEDAQAGLCGRCWSGLLSLPEDRCRRCALVHDSDRECLDPVAWERGDALWNYHGGRPPLGALLVPAIKDGELGWKRALLGRLEAGSLPDLLIQPEFEVVTCAPATPLRRLLRGFDLAEEAARLLAARSGRPFQRLLAKTWRTGRQAERTESERRRLPQRAIRLRRGAEAKGRRILVVDDVWTTGATLLRCAQALRRAGAQEIQVLALFRAL